MLLDNRASAPPARRDAARRTPASVTGSISAVAFSFIVQEPSGIIEVVSERSFASSRRM